MFHTLKNVRTGRIKTDEVTEKKKSTLPEALGKSNRKNISDQAQKETASLEENEKAFSQGKLMTL